MKFTTVSTTALLALIPSVVSSPVLENRKTNPNLVSIVVTKSYVTYKVNIDQTYKKNGVYSVASNLALTIKNAPTHVIMQTSATSTVLSTSTSYGVYDDGKGGPTRILTTTIMKGVPTPTKPAAASSSASKATPTAKANAINCGVGSDGPTELGWETSAGNFPANSWKDCYWTCMEDINYCSSFAFAKNGAMPKGQECIIVEANTTHPKIYNSVGNTKGDFVLYDAQCSPPPATKPVTVSSKQCGIPSDVFGGVTVETLQTAEIGSFTFGTLQECKAKCDFFKGYCASYSYNGAADSCGIYSVTIEAPGAYENMNRTDEGGNTWYSYDAGCKLS
ncbi:hypothetical protein PVAG01_02725 [Phlyctema vagabunda]|uniref:Apple domain-containing protein n=1 Tax=Phlyctema vagabunda TaxID=108571 RepID=A0ABR4PRN6_9HELO